MKPLSVILCTFNEPHQLELALHGWARQRNKMIDVHVCDDGGYDPPETESIVRAFSNHLAIHLHYLEPMSDEFRLAEARNMGVRAAKAERILITDGDCVPTPETGMAHSSYGSDLTIVAGLRDHIPMHMVPMLRTGDVPKMARFVHGHDYRLYNTEFMALAGQESGAGDWLCWGCHVSYPTRKVCEIGGFDPEYKGWGGEDVDLAIRLTKHKCNITLRPDLVVYHLDHEQSAQHNEKQAEMLQASRSNPNPTRGRSIRFRQGTRS